MVCLTNLGEAQKKNFIWGLLTLRFLLDMQYIDVKYAARLQA